MVNILNTIRLGRGVRLFGLAFIPLLSFVSLFAQQGGTGVCQGGVTDAETHRALEGVLVRDASGYHGAVTDAEGRYTVALPAGRYKLNTDGNGRPSRHNATRRGASTGRQSAVRSRRDQQERGAALA